MCALHPAHVNEICGAESWVGFDLPRSATADPPFLWKFLSACPDRPLPYVESSIVLRLHRYDSDVAQDADCIALSFEEEPQVCPPPCAEFDPILLSPHSTTTR